MQEALPYKTWLPAPQQPFLSLPPMDYRSVMAPRAGSDIKSAVSENAVIVVSRRGCCMSHVVKRLLQGLGANPAVYDVEEHEEDGVVKDLEGIAGPGEGFDRRLQFPAVFIGGRLFGGLDRIMATHITGELVPVLKQAGALWL
ncbi:glutaredoxin-C9-like [Diospyros lotus]|uniref:glutaredoxin-C9-like n=1 Tax=Diospyros lotus TaxID=55363 RepID=UPI002254912F|nr:glutaredoxin-C9-like [Diospyros lotus]